MGSEISRPSIANVIPPPRLSPPRPAPPIPPADSLRITPPNFNYAAHLVFHVPDALPHYIFSKTAHLQQRAFILRLAQGCSVERSMFSAFKDVEKFESLLRNLTVIEMDNAAAGRKGRECVWHRQGTKRPARVSGRRKVYPLVVKYCFSLL